VLFYARECIRLDSSGVLLSYPTTTNSIAHDHYTDIYPLLNISLSLIGVVIKASEPVVSVILNLIFNKVVPKPLTALSLLPVTYGVAYASTLGKLNWKTMSKELGSKTAKYVNYVERVML